VFAGLVAGSRFRSVTLEMDKVDQCTKIGKTDEMDRIHILLAAACDSVTTKQREV
jgi:hypothetical protein